MLIGILCAYFILCNPYVGVDCPSMRETEIVSCRCLRDVTYHDRIGDGAGATCPSDETSYASGIGGRNLTSKSTVGNVHNLFGITYETTNGSVAAYGACDFGHTHTVVKRGTCCPYRESKGGRVLDCCSDITPNGEVLHMTAKIVEQCIGCGSTRQVHVDGVTSSVKCSGIRTSGRTKHEIYIINVGSQHYILAVVLCQLGESLQVGL